MKSNDLFIWVVIYIIILTTALIIILVLQDTSEYRSSVKLCDDLGYNVYKNNQCYNVSSDGVIVSKTNVYCGSDATTRLLGNDFTCWVS